MAILGVLASGPSAWALTGKPVLIGTPGREDRPAVAVDSAGNGVIAWANTSAAQPAPQSVEYCVLAPGGSACNHSGTLALGQPQSSRQTVVDGVQVVVDQSTYTVLANVKNTVDQQNGNALQAWQSTDGGATWTTALDNGTSLSSAAESNWAGTGVGGSDNAILMPGGGQIGYGYDSATGPPTFSTVAEQSPPACPYNGTAQPACPFASLQSSTDPNLVGNLDFHFASQQGANAGVLGIFRYDRRPNGVSCGPDSLGYVYGAGDQSATNDYNVTAGQPNSAWKHLGVGQLFCGESLRYPAVAGGPSGFGLLTSDDVSGDIVYHSIGQTVSPSAAFRVNIASGLGESTSLSQDAAGGIYATWVGTVATNYGSGLYLAYSADGGQHWAGPQVIKQYTSTLANSSPRSAVAPGGQGWIAWLNQGQVYAQQFDKTDANPLPTTLTTSQTAPTASGPSITVPAGTRGVTDAATIGGGTNAIPDAPRATGTVHYVLFNSNACSAASQVFDGGTQAVGNASSPTPALPAGTYYWLASYSGDSLNAPSSSTCGSETLTIAGPPPGSVPVTIKSSAPVTSKAVTLTVGCAVAPCNITISITVNVTGGRNAHLARVKRVTVATGHYVLSAGEARLAVRLTAAGKRLLSGRRAAVHATVNVAQISNGHTSHQSKAITLTKRRWTR